MRKMIAAMAVASALTGGPVAVLVDPDTDRTALGQPPPPAGSVFADLAALGYDLGKFRPDYAGRFPYR